MNDYTIIGKSLKTGKPIARILCTICKNYKEVQLQSKYKKDISYVCSSCARKGKKNPAQSARMKGSGNPNYGGISETHRKNLSIAKTGCKLNLSKELRIKKREIGANNLKKWMNENPEKHVETSRKGGINSLILQSDYGRISSIEQKTMNWIENKNIEFTFQFPIGNRFLYDFKIKNLIIEVNGDWFHNQSKQIEKDKIKKQHAENAGYELIYIWEHEVNAGDFTKLENKLCELKMI